MINKKAPSADSDSPYEQLLAMPNYDIVTIALGLLATDVGSSLEEIALECHRLIPSRFCWVQHPDIPDMDAPRVSLTDARKEKNGAKVESHVLRAGRRKFQWRLTAAGHAWINKHEKLVRYLQLEFPQAIDYHARSTTDLLSEVLHHLEYISNITAVDVAREALRRFPGRFAVADTRIWPDLQMVYDGLKSLGASISESGSVLLPTDVRVGMRKYKRVKNTAKSLPSNARARDERLKYLNHVKASQLFKRFTSLSSRGQPTLGEICSLLVAPMNSSEADLVDALDELEERLHGIQDANIQPFFAWIKRAIEDL